MQALGWSAGVRVPVADYTNAFGNGVEGLGGFPLFRFYIAEAVVPASPVTGVGIVSQLLYIIAEHWCADMLQLPAALSAPWFPGHGLGNERCAAKCE